MRVVRTLMLTALIGWTATASALPLDPRGNPDQFRRDVEEINRRPLPDERLLAQAVANTLTADAARRGTCQSKKASIGKLEPVTMDGTIVQSIVAGQIENGWLISVKLEDCPPAAPIRLLVLRGTDGSSVQAIFAGQGETLAWPSLSRELLRAATGATGETLRGNDPACTPSILFPVDIKVTSTSPDFGPSVYGIRLNGSWNELWTFAPCGHRVFIPLTIRPDGLGGANWEIDRPAVRYSK